MHAFRLFLPAGLVGLALLAGSVRAPAADIEAGLPADAATVVTVHIKQLLHAPVAKQCGLEAVRLLCRNTEAVRTVWEDLRLDPFRDLDRLTVATTGVGDNAEAVVILRGRFDTARFAAAAKSFVKEHSDRLEIHKEDGLKYISVLSTGRHGSILLGAGASAKQGAVLNVRTKGCLLDMFRNDCITLLDKNTLVAATSEALLKQTCRQIADRDTSALNKPMRRLLKELESKQTITFALCPPSPKIEAVMADDSEAQEVAPPSPLRELTGSIRVTDDVELRCAVRTNSIADAREVMRGFDDLRLRAEGLMLLLAGSSKRQAFLKDIPRSFLAVRKGNVILVEGRLSPETLGKLLGMARTDRH